MAPGPSITPVLRYRDPRTAARWLGEAFGFAVHETVEGSGGEITYVLLRQGANFVLVLPVADAGLDALLIEPQAVGGANTQVCYVTVGDARAHRDRAQRAGARIEIEPQDDGLGGQFYTCSDLDGHLWTFGTRAYGAVGAGAVAEDRGEAYAAPRAERRAGGRVLARRVVAAAALALAAAGGWSLHGIRPDVDSASASRVDGVLEDLAQERRRLAGLESAKKEAEEKFAEQRAMVGEVRRTLQQALSELAAERERKNEAMAAQAALKAAALKLEQGKARAEAELAAGREKMAKETAVAASAAERTAGLLARVAKLRAERAAVQEELGKAKALLAGAEAQLKALREAKAEVRAPPVAAPAIIAPPPPGPPPAVAAEPQQEAAKIGAAAPAADPAPAMPQSLSAEPSDRNGGAPEPAAAKAARPPPPPKSACVAAVEGRWKTPGPWAQRLCQGAEGSPEPVRCYEELMRGKVSWGGGTAWTAPHALNLCAGSRNARQTIDCFSGKVAADEPWQAAINDCRRN
jgi:uncharacterized glyoxalase superfamily protein PhnB